MNEQRHAKKLADIFCDERLSLAALAEHTNRHMTDAAYYRVLYWLQWCRQKSTLEYEDIDYSVDMSYVDNFIGGVR